MAAQPRLRLVPKYAHKLVSMLRDIQQVDGQMETGSMICFRFTSVRTPNSHQFISS